MTEQPYTTNKDGTSILNDKFFSDKHLLVLTPCFGGQVTASYMNAILGLITVSNQVGLRISFQTISNESLISRARNCLTSVFLADKRFTHLMFIDADIGFHGEDVLRMMARDIPIIAGVYPMKSIDWDRVRELVKDDVKDIEYRCSPYAVNSEKTQLDSRGLLEVTAAATGFMLIKREVFDKLIAAHPELKYKHDGNGFKESADYFYNLWDCFLVGDRYLSEDYAFCHLWRELGEKVFIDPAIELTHNGSFEFKGRLIS